MTSRMRLMGAVALAVSLASSASAGSGGPDSFGYTWYDINDVKRCPVVNDVMVPTQQGGFTNFVSPTLDLGFNFPFYDRIVTQIQLNQGGLIFFQAAPMQNLYINQQIPRGDGIGGFLAPAWGFWNSPTWEFETDPVAGVAKVAFHFARPALGGSPFDAEIYLFRSGDIRIEYLNPSDNATMTIGMENYTENGGLQMRYNANQSGGMTYGTPTPFSICINRRKNLDCGVVQTIACNSTTAGVSPGSVTTNALTWGCGSGSWAGKEKVYRIDLTDLTDMSVTLSGTGTRVMAAYLLSACNEWECIAGGSGSFNAFTLTPGTYYIAVDAAARNDEGAFNLTVACSPLSDPIACDDTVSDTTVGEPNRLDAYSCLLGDFSGDEQFYSIDFTPPGNINASLTSATGQGVFIFDATRPLDADNCLVGGVGGTVLYSPPAGTYLIAVDGPAGGDGAYTLNVTCSPELSCTPLAGVLDCQQKLTGSTVGLANRADFYRCAVQQFDGPEAVYTFANTTQQVVSFVLETANRDLDLILLNSCNEGDCDEIGGDSISQDLPPGTYYIVVDGKNGAAADYTLSVICGFGLEPALLSVTGAEGECFTEHKQSWLTPAIVQADVLFTIDLTGSMGGELSQLQNNMQDIIDRLQVFIQDVAFGLGSYMDYPGTFDSCGYNVGYGVPSDYPWRLDQPITQDRTAIQNAVSSLTIGNGNDAPESYCRALYESINDPSVAWRPGSRRLVVDFGDELPHDCNVQQCLGGTSGSRGIDPGRDNAVGTPDDLTILGAIAEFVNTNTVLLHLDSSGGGVDGAFTYNDLWDCWARQTAGQSTPLNSDGTVPGNIDLAQLVGDLIRQQAAYCPELQLVAEPGYESWVSVVGPVYSNVGLPATAEFDITFCVPAGTPPGPYAFLVNLMCGDQIVTSQQVQVDVTIDCSASVVSTPQDVTICSGDSALLDASGMTLVNCPGTDEYAWTDGLGNPVGTGPMISVTPTATTDYSVDLTCSADPRCATRATATVTVEKRPALGAGQAQHPAVCQLGIEVTWDAAAFPSGSGTYNVYRSETDCADAMTRPPVSPRDFAGTRFLDLTTRSGRAYYYVVQAEDSAAAVACRPPGPNNGGVVSDTTICVGPVQEIDDTGFPDYLGWALRVSHSGPAVTLDVTGSRPLLPGEHFHVLKGYVPQVLGQVNPERQTAPTWTETDTSRTLQFFDVRIANSCEEQSLDDEPPTY